MKYSMVSVAAFVASSLASPAFWDESIKPPGPITITNNMNQAVRLNRSRPKYMDVDEFDEDVEGISTIIPQGRTITISTPPPIQDLKLSVLQAPGNQVEVAYASQGPAFKYAIKRIEHDRFPGVVSVQPQPQSHECRRLTLFPHRPNVGPVRCRAGTRLRVTLCQQGHPHCPPPSPNAEDEIEWL
ncbi:hypothetical protein MGU_02289 [Metarhizium guizhouense ARSEF 977]|uniref:Uncharacterized protein n=1 Tax=Metarhizium guizhouense (strain ARSEF 977) TaxID=1276136 RepID=A0A0B4HE01_METGA|nr:hypothetical protein MGU_02289 [Metarhizium guizhouense ARSEF 977]